MKAVWPIVNVRNHPLFEHGVSSNNQYVFSNTGMSVLDIPFFLTWLQIIIRTKSIQEKFCVSRSFAIVLRLDLNLIPATN
jgi:hypothetical protein